MLSEIKIRRMLKKVRKMKRKAAKDHNRYLALHRKGCGEVSPERCRRFDRKRKEKGNRYEQLLGAEIILEKVLEFK